MQFMMLVKAAENSGPPPQALMDAIGKMAEEATKAGLMLQSGGLAPTAMSSRVRLSQGKLTTTDGPFGEFARFRPQETAEGWAYFELDSAPPLAALKLAFGSGNETEVVIPFAGPEFLEGDRSAPTVTASAWKPASRSTCAIQGAAPSNPSRTKRSSVFIRWTLPRATAGVD